MTNFTNTIAAAQRFAVKNAEHQEIMTIADTLEDIEALERDMKIEANKLRAAFYEDTKHLNSQNDVALMEPKDIITIIASPDGLTVKQYLENIIGAEA